MAFQDESRLYKCGRSDCHNERKYFRMIESCREQDSYIGEGVDDEPVTKYRRICEECELKSRLQEFPDRPARWREKYPNYCDEKAIAKTLGVSRPQLTLLSSSSYGQCIEMLQKVVQCCE